MATFRQNETQLRAAGWAIAVAAIVTLFAVLIHPSLGGRNPARALADIVTMGPMDRLVHGVVIAAEIVLLASFSIVSTRLGMGRLAVVAAFAAYAIGVGSTIAAAVIDGFITPDVAAQYAGGPQTQIGTGIALLTLCSIALQDLTKVGTAAMSAAIVVWSLALFERTSLAARGLGVLGIASSVFAVAMLSVTARISPHVLLAAIAAQILWYVGVGIAVTRLSA
jgi:hypothetical protein